MQTNYIKVNDAEQQNWHKQTNINNKQDENPVGEEEIRDLLLLMLKLQ